MNISKQILFFPLLIGLSASVFAFSPLSTGELSELCEEISTSPESEKSMQCARYIKGFIDGAIAIDSSVVSKRKTNLNAPESDVEKMIRNYLTNRVARFSKTQQNNFCLSKPLELEDIVIKVTRKIAQEEDTEKLALHSVYETLQTEYPCDQI